MWLKVTIGPTKPKEGETERYYFVEGITWSDVAWRAEPFVRDGECIRTVEAFTPQTHFVPLSFDEGMRQAMGAIEEAYGLSTTKENSDA